VFILESTHRVIPNDSHVTRVAVSTNKEKEKEKKRGFLEVVV
jgi:hypothetical protein